MASHGSDTYVLVEAVRKMRPRASCDVDIVSICGFIRFVLMYYLLPSMNITT